jgi:hypothetical protein
MSNSVAIGVAYADQDIINANLVLANAKTGIVGYTTGSATVAIPAVIQATSKSTGVTLNAAAGKITMNAASLGATTAVAFTLTNNQIATNDILVCNVAGGIATSGTYAVRVLDVSAGAAKIEVTNISGGSLSEAVVINFATLQITQR